MIKHLHVPAVEKAGYEAVQPQAEGNDVIHSKFIRELESCDMVLADISTLNPNCLFELGIRTALDKPVAIVRDPFTDFPFDIAPINTHTYQPFTDPWEFDKQITDVCEHLKKCADPTNPNSMWKTFALTSKGSLAAADSGGLEAKIDFLLQEVAGLRSMKAEPTVLVINGKSVETGDLARDWRVSGSKLGFDIIGPELRPDKKPSPFLELFSKSPIHKSGAGYLQNGEGE